MSNPTSHHPIAVRVLGDADRAALDQLAGRDSSNAPAGEVLGAEVDGALVAALSLSDGTAISDPFRSSGPALELLELRARQLGGKMRLRLPRRRTREHARGTLAGSPPGAGGRLLRL